MGIPLILTLLEFTINNWSNESYFFKNSFGVESCLLPVSKTLQFFEIYAPVGFLIIAATFHYISTGITLVKYCNESCFGSAAFEAINDR